MKMDYPTNSTGFDRFLVDRINTYEETRLKPISRTFTVVYVEHKLCWTAMEDINGITAFGASPVEAISNLCSKLLHRGNSLH